MPFVKRNQAGEVIAAYAEAQPDAGEYLAPDSAELSPLVSAASAEAGTVQAMTESDLDLVRVLEDLVNALLHKNIIQPTDLYQRSLIRTHAPFAHAEGMIFHGWSMRLFQAWQPARRCLRRI